MAWNFLVYSIICFVGNSSTCCFATKIIPLLKQISFFPGTSLIWTGILGLIVLFIYAVLSFATLHNKFVADNDDGPLYCDTLTQCMYSVLRYGLIDNIGLVNSNGWMDG